MHTALNPRDVHAKQLTWAGSILSDDPGKFPFWQPTLLRTQGVDLAWFPSTKLLIAYGLDRSMRTALLYLPTETKQVSRRWFNTVLLNKSLRNCVPCLGQEDTLTCQSQQEQQTRKAWGAPFVGFSDISREAEQNKDILLSNHFCYINETPQLWRGLGMNERHKCLRTFYS